MKKGKNFFIALMILILPISACAIENQNVVSLIGYEFTNVKDRRLEIDYRLDLMYYELKELTNAWEVEDKEGYRISNALFFSYDIAHVIALNVLAPYIYAYSDMGTQASKETADFGDVSIGAKAQLHNSKHATINLNLNYVTSETGSSPYEVNPDHDLATGNGYDSIQTQFSVCTWFNPISPFLSLQYHKNFLVKETCQFVYNPGLSWKG